MKAVRKVKHMTYTDGEGKKYKLKNAIVIDLTKDIPLEKLLEEAISLSDGVISTCIEGRSKNEEKGGDKNEH